MHQSTEVVNKLKDALDVLTEYREIWQNSCTAMKTADLGIADIMHELEFTEFDPEKGNELALEIQRLRKQRRFTKEDQSIFILMKSFCEKNSTFIARLKETVDRMKAEEEGRSMRLYTPRVRTEQMSIIYAGEEHQEIAVIEDDGSLESAKIDEVIQNYT